MAKYNWTIDTLIERLRLIEKLLTIETKLERLKLLNEDYNNLIKHIEDYFDYRPFESMKLLESYDFIKQDLGKIKFLWSDYQEFRSIIDKPIEVPELKRCSLRKEDLLSITHDFYKSLNSFFFGNFMKSFYRRNDHIVFRSYNNSDLSGETTTLPSLRECFIEIFRDGTSEDILTTIHEYMHATSVLINPYHLCQEKSLYTEIDALFMELIASDYIANLFKDNSATIFKAEKLNDYLSNSDDLAVMIDAITHEPKNGYQSNKELKRIAESEYDVLPEEIDAIIGEPELNSTIYLTSYMFALELYKMYQNDKEKALYYLKKIILLENMSEEEYYSNIKRFGLFPNLSLKEHYQETKKDALRLTRKKSNSKK